MTEETIEKPSLAALAEQITQFAIQADDHTLKAALLIREAKARVESGEAGETTWNDWATDNLSLSEGRIRELLRIANAENPQEELERIRAQTRDRVARHREKAAALRNAAAGATSADAPDPERQRLIAWVQEAAPQLVAQVLAYIEAIDRDNAPPAASDQVGG